MHAKQYEALAQAIKENTVPSIHGFIQGDTFIEALCDILAADNKNFNKEKFMEACK